MSCGCKRARHEHGDYMNYIVHGCRCADCRAANAARENRRLRAIAYGRYEPPYVDADPVRAHIRMLNAEGMGYKAIARAANLTSMSVMTRIMYGRGSRAERPQPRIKRSTAERILAVRPTLDTRLDGQRIDGTGTRRRLQALIAIGWARPELAARLDVDGSSLGRTLRGEQVYVSTARAVRALYDELWDATPPQSTRWEKMAYTKARREAEAKCWPPPMGWDDDTIDHPEATPGGGLQAAA